VLIYLFVIVIPYEKEIYHEKYKKTMYLKKINKMKRTIKKSQLSAIHDELTVVVTSD